MAILPRLLTTLGVVLLAHAAYSTHEHSALSAKLSSSSSTDLPPDIILETLISVLLVCVGLVTGADPLQPIAWREWAGQMEREGKREGIYAVVEERRGFVDIRAKRKEFADWVRGKDTLALDEK
ncbi:hypothetical protein MMC20_003509 [Loxospora ochrophaea]|nr:hypothetical protein [Loxospora ochrophaea]